MSTPITQLTAADGTVEDARPILSRAEAHDGTSPISDQALLAVAQGQRKLLTFHNSVGETVAAGVIGQGELDLVVDPQHRGRGVASAALSLLLPHAVGDTLAWAHGENPAANALLARAGFTPVRSLYRMALDPALLPTVGSPVEVPKGFTLRTFNPESSEDAAAWVRVNAAAFATHPEQGRITEADFALMRREPWYNNADLLLLEAPGSQPGSGPRLAGSTWIKTVPTEDSDTAGIETELYAVGVDPEFAGQGLGRTLLDATLTRMAEHAPERVTLYVDGENERAVRMYESAGFSIDSRSQQWRLVSTGEFDG